jgi:hypothetical protein
MESITVEGFDAQGEPTIQALSDGSVQVVFHFMPPFDVSPEEEYFFNNFDNEMQKVLGVDVYWEDREVFLIPEPQKDTVPQLKAFLKSCRKG